MRSIALVLFLVTVAAVTGVVRTAETEGSAAAASASPAPAATDAVPSPVQQPPPKVTVRVAGGRDNVRIGPGEHARGKKGRVDNPGLARNPDRPGSTSLVVEGQGVSLADEGDSGEGMLTRIHVDADDDLTAVIGFYSAIDADRPVNNPNTYACKKCGGVLVCGIDPQCM